MLLSNTEITVLEGFIPNFWWLQDTPHPGGGVGSPIPSARVSGSGCRAMGHHRGAQAVPQEPPALLLRDPCPAGTLPGHLPAPWGPPIPALAPPGSDPCVVWGVTLVPLSGVGITHRDPAQGCVWSVEGSVLQTAPLALPQPVCTSVPVPGPRQGAPRGPGDPNPQQQHRDPQGEQGHSLVGPQVPPFICSPPACGDRGSAGMCLGRSTGPTPKHPTPHTPHPRPLRAARLSQSRGWSWAGGRGLCWEPGLEGQVPGWAGVSARCRGWRLGVPGWKVKSRAGQRGRAGPCGAVQLRAGRGAGPAARQHLSRPCEWPRTHFPAPAAPIKERRSQI